MSSDQIYPVILCGGSGTRLWPVSRAEFPKQFSPFVGNNSLFQQTAQRLTGPGFAQPLVITGEKFRFLVGEQLDRIGVTERQVLIEPDARNTAPAVAVACLYLARRDPDALMLIAPSDHVIVDASAFRAAVMAAVPAAKAGRLVTFGITPSRAETGYGYLELDSVTDVALAPVRGLTRFVEKPDAMQAQAMLTAGKFLWNAGIFLFSVRAALDAYRIHAPQVLTAAEAALFGAREDLGFLRLDATAWADAPSISIDFAIMERATNLAVMPYNQGWSDLGSWDAVHRHGEADDAGLVQSGPTTALDCTDTLLRSEPGGPELVGIGLHGIVAVATDDGVLVADASRSQDVKMAVDALRAKGVRAATAFARDHRPWGWFESLAMGPRFQVKRIVVKPGGILSLQSHHHRAEHWIVVEGTARVTINDETRLVSENQSVYIPLGSMHRLENPGKLPMVLIEVQTGAYLGEDDIQRYEDAYSRR